MVDLKLRQQNLSLKTNSLFWLLYHDEQCFYSYGSAGLH